MASSFITNALEFFDTALVQDGDITCAVSGKYVAIPEDRFAGIFNLPTEGLTDLSEVPNNLVLQARTLFSKSNVPVQFSCKKRLMKYEFRLLNDILAKSITVKAGSFDAVTHERFLMITAIHFGIKVNWSKIIFEVLKEMVDKTIKRAKGFAAQICVLLKCDPAVTLGETKTFPPLKILSAKTVNTYVATNKTIDARGETDEPEVAKVAIVKKKSVSKKRSVSTAIKDTAEVQMDTAAPAVKNKRTTTGKAASKKRDLGLVSVAPEAVPIQMIEPISAVPAESPPAPKRNALKRKFRMPAAAEPTKIKSCRGIEIRGVEADDWYKENLPKIAATDKGKKPLEEPNTVKGNLAPLFEKSVGYAVIQGHSFQRKKMLVWAETDSLEKAVQRRMFIIAKYREYLLRKFLLARRTNLVSGQPTTAIDQQIMDLLSGAHQQAVRNLLKQMRTHGLQ
ncbi:hypothetical protein F511_08328 [Dorcoceras hygrometricum]|uniref:Uncharacterized protein n=1 Tax=Dorcoceras hygrometricum TaxID=472368 RepID=A0A2Z7DE62_9LAMI|nr:hypothetical protein F511_08328 [Dorcoceras hygrometricum]